MTVLVEPEPVSYTHLDVYKRQNEGRGYVLRRIIRRAILAARRAGSERAVTKDLVAATIEKMGEAYPVLVRDREIIEAVLEREEAGFARTLRTGLTLLEDCLLYTSRCV